MAGCAQCSAVVVPKAEGPGSGRMAFVSRLGKKQTGRLHTVEYAVSPAVVVVGIYA